MTSTCSLIAGAKVHFIGRQGAVISMVFWLRVATTVAGCAGLAMPPVSAARSQTMCVKSEPNCERDADDKLPVCASYCGRYDNACTDACHDSHEIAVRYCAISRTVCAEIERAKQEFLISTRRDGPR